MQKKGLDLNFDLALEKINDLIPVAEGLNSPMAPHIVSYLKDAADGHMPE